jgi:uncharacterized FlaG/YvyC family protein
MGTEIEAVIRAGPAEMSLSHFQAGSATARPTEQGEPRASEKGRETEKSSSDEPARPTQKIGAQGNVDLVFEVSKDGKDLVIKIVDRDHDRVLRTIPPEELQQIRSAMRDLVGLLVDRKG